jgi:periplasmic divalent cation tolerance protein
VPDPQPLGPPGGVTHVQIQFTIDDPDRADRIIEQLLLARAVACGQRIGPIVSRYWWQGSVEGAEEWLVLLKTRVELGAEVIDAVVEAHPYETPEVVAVDLVAGAAGYLSWIDQVTAATATIGRNVETEER